MSKMTSNITIERREINVENEFLKALHMDIQYSRESIRSMRVNRPLKEELEDTMHEKIYTLQNIFSVISEDDGTGNQLFLILAKDDNFRSEIWKYVNRYFRKKLWESIDLYKTGSNDSLNSRKKREGNLDDEFNELLQICESLVEAIYSNNSETEYEDPNILHVAIIRANNKIEKALKRYIDDGEKGYTIIDLIKIHIYTQLLSFINVLDGDGFQDEMGNYREAVHCIAYFIMCEFSKRGVPYSSEGTAYGKEAIKIRNIKKRQIAFNEFGMCAVEKGDRQLAYDIYYSWINRCFVGELKDESFSAFDIDEKEFLKEINIGMEAIIHNNFACVCSEIALCYKCDNEKRKYYYDISVREINKAIEFDCSRASFYCAYADLLCENADLFGNDNNYINALKYYEEYWDKGDDKEKVEASRLKITAILHIFMNEWEKIHYKNFNTVIEKHSRYYNDLWDSIREYQEEATNYFIGDKDNGTIEKEEWRLWRETFNLFKKLKNYIKDDRIRKYFIFLLLMIQETSNSIKDELQWKNYLSNEFYTREEEKPDIKVREKAPEVIGYYTSLKTATYIFDELVKGYKDVIPRPKKDDDPKDSGINCLTVMHAKYMNDPDEGLILLRELAKSIDEKIKETKIKSDESIDKLKLCNVIWPDRGDAFRDKLFDSYFIFLKSFTNEVDDLVMWNRYASDPSVSGQDSNGCFVELDNTAFNMTVLTNTRDRDKKEENDKHEDKGKERGKGTKENKAGVIKKNKDVIDDYNLYHVVYFSKDGLIGYEKNSGLSGQVEPYYNLLKGLVCELNLYLCTNYVRKSLDENRDYVINYVLQFLQQSLRFISFLFKEDEYADEKESRIVFTRNANQTDLVRLLDNKKLCINPFSQIYINKIIFGPNCRDEEIWEPYFQYQLNKMWEKHPDIKNKTKESPEQNYTIEKSKKHYRTFENDQ